MKAQIHILANSRDLLEASPEYAYVAKYKASKLKRQRMQAKKQAVELAIINSIDNIATYEQLKSKRAAAAAKQEKIAAKRLTSAQRVKIA